MRALSLASLCIAALLAAAAAQPASAQTIKIGVFGPLTGDAAAMGSSEKEAVELATSYMPSQADRSPNRGMRCRIVEERPAPSVGVVIGGAGFGVRTEAESRMRTVEQCHESGTTGGGVQIEEIVRG